jgi:hypothetical protein
VNLASRGLRDLDTGTGPEAIEEKEILAQVRRQAAAVYRKSALAAVLATALMVVLP